MLQKPPSCDGCPLRDISTGFMRPALAAHPYGVALLGEALGEDEAEQGAPFVGRAGFRLTRLIEWAGLDRGRFDIYNAAWCRPPGNALEGTPYELPSIAHCQAAHWGALMARSRVVVPMGNVATGTLVGRKGILGIRGYIYPGPAGVHVIPTVHPSFIQRGQSRWSAAFINDIQKAVTIARDGVPIQFTRYLLDPSPMEAYGWAKRYRAELERDPRVRLAFDIETPGKGDDEEDVDTDSDAPDRTWNIERIGFSYAPLTALSIPWAPEYRAAIALVLGSPGDKVVWNAGFDVPRIRRAGVEIGGTIHDGMVAWHILHSDLPKRLAFVATFATPYQPAWKHLSGSQPAFYNATDADVEWRCMEHIDRELRRVGLWEVYERDVVALEPILVHMHSEGMRIDPAVRLDRALKLQAQIDEVVDKMEGAVPLEARRIEHVYKAEPRDTTGLLTRPCVRAVKCCRSCGIPNPRKDHFRHLVKRVNPCDGAGTIVREVEGTEYYRLSEFTPSREQLVRYNQSLHRPLPMTWDKKAGRRKVSFGEKQIKEQMVRYPLDPLYPLVLQYRSLDKIAGTYIGRPSD